MFDGVHVSILHFMEYIFKLRINVYEIHSLKKAPPSTACTQCQQQRQSFADRYVPVIQPVFISTSSPHVYTTKTLNLLLYDNHYYTISDIHRLLNVHYRCISCGTQFTGHKLSSIKRHILNRCGKIRYQYRRGCVDTYENMWDEAKRVYSIPDSIMSPLDDRRRFTSLYATFDFESMLVKEDVIDVEHSSQTGVAGIDDDGVTECTEQEYVDKHRDMQYITVNTPLSYAIACNVPASIDDFEFNDRLRPYDQHQRDDIDALYTAYGVSNNPEHLIRDFVTTLIAIARVRRRYVIEQYADIIQHITRWFSEKYIRIDLTSSPCGGCDESIATIDHEAIEYHADGSDDMKVQYTCYASQQLDVCWREIRLLSKLIKFINHLPVLGFNSGGYDIPLIKPWLFSELVSLTSDDSLEFVKKSSTRYMSLTVYGLPHDVGGFVFLDVMQYLAPGFNLDTFIKSFSSSSDEEGDTTDDNNKSYFPYEYIDSYDKLTETELPPYDAFYSKLKQENVLDAEYQQYIVHKLGLTRGTQLTDPEHIAHAPLSGLAKYHQLRQMWKDYNWTCIGDYLEYYNTKDVVPFLRAVIRYTSGLQQTNNVDVVRDAISLPGLAKQILRQHIPHRSLFYIDDPSIYSLIKDNEVGGQSIIFTRRNDEDHPHVKGFDANSLYLYCLGEGQFTGRPILYESVADDSDVLIRRRLHRRYPGSKHVISKDSVTAEEYLDYLDTMHLRPHGINMIRQYRISLTLNEQQYLLTTYDQAHIPKSRLFSTIYVDGYYVTDAAVSSSSLDLKERHVVEFDGCYWHACQECGACPEEGYRTRYGVWISADKQRIINESRYDILRKRGYVLHVMKECEWTRLKREDNNVRAYCQHYISTEVDPLVSDPERPYITSTQLLLRMLCDKRVFGIVVCDVRVPTVEEDGGYLRRYFEDFAPIIKHAHINYNDIGIYMQDLADKSDISVKDRRAVIDSYYGRHIALIDEYIVWLYNKGCIISRIYKFIRYDKRPIFKDFVCDITKMRIKGDKDKNSEMPALTAN